MNIRSKLERHVRDGIFNAQALNRFLQRDPLVEEIVTIRAVTPIAVPHRLFTTLSDGTLVPAVRSRWPSHETDLQASTFPSRAAAECAAAMLHTLGIVIPLEVLPVTPDQESK